MFCRFFGLLVPPMEVQLCVPRFDLLTVAASAAPGSMWLSPREEVVFSVSSPCMGSLCPVNPQCVLCQKWGCIRTGGVILLAGTGLAVCVPVPQDHFLLP